MESLKQDDKSRCWPLDASGIRMVNAAAVRELLYMFWELLSLAHGNIEANRCMSSRLIVRGGTPRSRGDGTVSDVDGEVAAEKEKKKKKNK